MNINTSRFCCALMALAATAAMGADHLEADLISCAAQTDDLARLRCYDQVVSSLGRAHEQAGSAPMRAPIGDSASGVAPSTSRQGADASAQDSPDPTEEFGQTHSPAPRRQSLGSPPRQLRKLTGRVATVTRKPSGDLIVRLENSQIWEQTEDGPDLHIVAGDEITIDRGLLGAYWLSTHRSHQPIKVRRTQ
jgi:hypothetical protein